MRRVAAALLLALAAGGCVAGMAVGAAGMAARAAAGGGAAPAQQPGAALILHGFGGDPNWSVNLFQNVTVFVGDDGRIRITEATPPAIATVDGHRFETARLTIDVAHAPCRSAMTGRTYRATVIAIADGREFRGCGTEMVEHQAPQAGE